MLTDPDGEQFDVLYRAPEGRGIGSVGWFPDSSSLVLSMYPVAGRLRGSNVWTIEVDGTDLQKVTFTRRRSEEYPAVSPDGSRIAAATFTRDDGPHHLLTMDIDGGNRELVAEAGDGVALVDWSESPT
jgi:Tol biopolymer transport system component